MTREISPRTMSRLTGIFYLAAILGGVFAQGFVALALVLLRINDDGAAIALAFFGPSTFIQGWLMLKSTFFPKWIGILAIAGGVAWTSFYWPPLGRSLFNVSAIIGLVGSFATIGWLIFRGVDNQRWREQAAVAATSLWR